MVKLVNGRGQLGKVLSEKIKQNEYNKNIYIYHTWNVLDKSEYKQIQEFAKFVLFVDEHVNDKIVFVSTCSKRSSFYSKSKLKAEKYLLDNCDKGVIVRLPTFICKGILTDLKEDKIKPYGILELISLQEAADAILKAIDENNKKTISIEGEKISAQNVYNILKL